MHFSPAPWTCLTSKNEQKKKKKEKGTTRSTITTSISALLLLKTNSSSCCIVYMLIKSPSYTGFFLFPSSFYCWKIAFFSRISLSHIFLSFDIFPFMQPSQKSRVFPSRVLLFYLKTFSSSPPSFPLSHIRQRHALVGVVHYYCCFCIKQLCIV